MSIPLDRLYHYLRDVCKHDIIIYRYFPHGSKKLTDCSPLSLDYTQEQKLELVYGIFHDQEPLAFSELQRAPEKWKVNGLSYYKNENFPFSWWRVRLFAPYSKYKLLLVHSEKNSDEVAKFEADGVYGAYWWSHAAIARDWFRYAEHDARLNFDRGLITHDFLVYNRAWAGTREYRLKFAELIVENNLTDNCKMKFSETDLAHNYKGNHYSTYKFLNSNFTVNTQLERYFDKNTHDSNSSADYESTDYQSCGIEIVLETLFDDQRLHLTEKSLRPIACKKPFILAATPGSLQYLKSYGFQTFDSLWDESYDAIVDPVQRLHAIIELMRWIKTLPKNKKIKLWEKCREICEHNQRVFFSTNFFNFVISEYVENTNAAIQNIKQTPNYVYYNQWASQQ